MRRSGFNGNGESGRVAAEALRTYTRFPVDTLKNFRFHFRIKFIGIFLRNAPAKSLFGKESTLLKISADADSENNWRTGIAACGFHTVKNIFYDILPAPRRRHHFKTAHIFAAEALGSNGDLHAVAVNNIHVNNGRRVVLGVHPPERIGHHRTAQITVHITVMYSFIDSVVKTAADKMHVLTYIKKNDRHTRILTDRYIQLLCRIKICLDISEHAFGKRISLTASAGRNCFGKVIGQELVCPYAKLGNRLCYYTYIYLSQNNHLQKTGAETCP